MLSSPDGILLAILLALAPAYDRDHEPGSGDGSTAHAQTRADISPCERFADRVIRENCVARLARPEGDDIKPDTQFPARVARIVPIDPGMPDHLRLVRNVR
jgi:hypothetical protein